jgi:tetratricopeptide (TPR) repeat protein
MKKEELKELALSKIGAGSGHKSNLIIINKSKQEHYETWIESDLNHAMLNAVDLLYEEKRFVDSVKKMDTLISVNFIDRKILEKIKGKSKTKETSFDEINDMLEENLELDPDNSFELWGYASNHGEFDGLPDTEECSRIYICLESIIEASERFDKNIDQYRYKEKLGEKFKFEVSSSFFSNPKNLIKIVLYHELGHCVAGHICEDGYTFDHEREAQFYCSIFFNSHIWSVYILYLSLFQPIEYQQRFLLYIDGRHSVPFFSPKDFTFTNYYHHFDGAIDKFYNLEYIYNSIKKWWLTTGSDRDNYEEKMKHDLLDVFWVNLNKQFRYR